MAKNKDVLLKPELLHLLKKNRKSIKISPIILQDRLHDPKLYETKVPAKISKQSFAIDLLVRKHKIIPVKYSFQLQCKELTACPYFRFESDGPSHRNGPKKGPLKGQQVDTPHFNTFDEGGNEIAYQTKYLKDTQVCEELKKDMDQGCYIFCKEINVRLNKSEYPTVELKKMQFPFPSEEYDPNASVNFIA